MLSSSNGETLSIGAPFARFRSKQERVELTIRCAVESLLSLVWADEPCLMDDGNDLEVNKLYTFTFNVIPDQPYWFTVDAGGDVRWTLREIRE